MTGAFVGASLCAKNRLALFLHDALAPFALRPGSTTAAGAFVPEHDTALLEIVRGHFNANPVAHD
jgi:hypothetical protein